MIPPPLTLREAAAGIFGALRLLRFDPAGMAALDTTARGAARSFWLMPWLFAPWLLIVAIQETEALAAVPFWRFLVVEAVGYVVAWVAFPLAMAWVTEMTGVRDRWTGWLAAYNWSAVPQVAIWLPALALAEAGILPDGASQLLLFAASLAIVLYHAFIARAALGLGALPAAMTVILDLLVSAVVNELTLGVMGVR